MKIIAVGDPHFQINNIKEVQIFIESFIEFLKKEDPDICILLGDILHTHERLHTIPLNEAYNFVDRCRQICPTYVIVGNHDMINNQVFLTDKHWMNGMKEWENVTIVDDVHHLRIKNRHFVLVPYVPPGRFEEALNTGEDWKNTDCIFAHQEFYGCKMGAIESKEGDKWSEDYPPVVSGHIHSNQTIGNVYYCGSAMQHAFGESERNIIPVLTWTDTDTKMYKLREEDLNMPRKKIIRLKPTQIENYDIKDTVHKEKLTVKADLEWFKAFKKTQKYKDIINSGRRVVFKPDTNLNINTEEYSDTKERSFTKIIDDLVTKENNEDLTSLYREVIGFS